MSETNRTSAPVPELIAGSMVLRQLKANIEAVRKHHPLIWVSSGETLTALLNVLASYERHLADLYNQSGVALGGVRDLVTVTDDLHQENLALAKRVAKLEALAVSNGAEL